MISYVQSLSPRGEVPLSDSQRQTLAAVTRAASTLSAIGVLTIITTFCLSRHFRNPMHRIILINAFYNAFDVVCTMISVSGYERGNKSALCQFQGFLNQMFPVADVLWTLVMAVDVYLIVFHCYDTRGLRRLEWKYMIGITVFTFIPAFVMLFIETEDKGPMYGGVTLWCAIAPKWVLFRIVIYYVPIWTSILITIILYILVGVEIVRRRVALQSLTNDSIVPLDDAIIPASMGENDLNDHENEHDMTIDDIKFPLPPPPQHVSTSYSVSTGSASVGTYSASIATSNYRDQDRAPRTPKRKSSRYLFRQYILMPLFFFLALLSVWVAPSTNRVAAFIDPSFGSYPLLLAVGISGSLRGFWNGLVFITVGIKSLRRKKEVEGDTVALRDMRRRREGG
ncbi:hypothetical protein V8F20_002311 [Naviculisporaceae sp. PSN 640]